MIEVETEDQYVPHPHACLVVQVCADIVPRATGKPITGVLSDGTFLPSILTPTSPFDYNVSFVGTLEVRDHSFLYLSA